MVIEFFNQGYLEHEKHSCVVSIFFDISETSDYIDRKLSEIKAENQAVLLMRMLSNRTLVNQ